MKDVISDMAFFFALGVVLALFLTVMEDTIRESVRYELRQQFKELELNDAGRSRAAATN